MKEQIEEMGKLCPFYEEGKCNLLEDEAAECNFDCDMCDFARTLYNAGYRKQKEGEWIEASDKPYAACGKKCSLCGARITYREFGCGNHKYCHKCGAKMKGGKENA